MRKFNITGNCVKDKHYMVDISAKLSKIKSMVGDERYFTINRARQYGKTTTLYRLADALSSEYVCILITFEGSEYLFESTEKFCRGLLSNLDAATRATNPDTDIVWDDESVTDFDKLKQRISTVCENRRIVLLADEVDRASDFRIFLSFLGMLRDMYLKRNEGIGNTFHSVILAGVHDIKNIKQRMITQGTHTLSAGEGMYNSPWNIATAFDVDMSFNPPEISTMLTDYENDRHTGMDITAVSEEIHRYTNGYPFLVSRICKCIDESLGKDWSADGIAKAVKIIIDEDNTLFDDIYKNMENRKELFDLLQKMLFTDFPNLTSAKTPAVREGLMYGILDKKDGKLRVANIMFETAIADYIVDINRLALSDSTALYQSPFVADGKLNMELVMRKFAEFMYEEYREADIKFIEQNGRLLFLSFLKPIINGTGFVFVEPQTRENKRIDIVVVYNHQRFVIELKIWYGDIRHNMGCEQLLGYMDAKNIGDGYMLTFDFRKDANKERKTEWVELNGRRIFDVIV